MRHFVKRAGEALVRLSDPREVQQCSVELQVISGDLLLGVGQGCASPACLYLIFTTDRWAPLIRSWSAPGYPPKFPLYPTSPPTLMDGPVEAGISSRFHLPRDCQVKEHRREKGGNADLQTAVFHVTLGKIKKLPATTIHLVKGPLLVRAAFHRHPGTAPHKLHPLPSALLTRRKGREERQP